MTKSMTCLQLGGPCNYAHQGEDHNDITRAQDQHLREAVKAGSSEHEPTLAEMKARWRRPISGLSGTAASSATSHRSRRRNDMSDWRHQTLERMRRLIHDAHPGIVEEVKWVKPSNPDGVPTWTCDGIVCTGELYKDKVKLTFARGASVPDPDGIFNASLEAGTRRAIDLHEGDDVDASAFKALVRRAAELNESRQK